jgi:hypothetical protein
VQTEAAVSVPAAVPGAGLVDLMEEHTHNVDATRGDWRFPLRAWEIASVRFGRRE